MTAKELSQYRSLKKEIEELTSEINVLDGYSVVKGSTSDFPYIMHNIKIQTSSFRTEEMNRLKKQRLRCREERQKISDFIESIADSELRRIFRYRYFDGLSWQAVAMKIGEHDESYPRRKHNKFLKNMQSYSSKQKHG